MNNPIMQALQSQALQSQANPQMAQIRQMINTVKAARNPQAMMNQLAQNNPQIRQIMSLVNQNGGDPKKAFYQLAQQKGVNPDEVLNMLK